MIKCFKLKLVLISLIICGIVGVFMTGVKTTAGADVGYCEIVIDRDSGRVLTQNRADEKRAIASTTKVVTAITVIENFDIAKQIEIKKEWTGIEGSSVYLKEGEKFTVEELLYGLMLRSGNDCAVTLACALSGSVENFAKLMNDVAKNCGAENSNFVNPHGLNAENHYSTARDLAKITAHAMKNQKFAQIVGTKNVKIGEGESVRVLNNKNKLLKNYPFATGVKTGYTKKAGRCLVSSANKNGFNLICVVLDCPPMFERSVDLFNEAFSNYKNVLIFEKDRAVGSIRVEKSKIYLPVYVSRDVRYPLTKEELKNIEIVENFSEIKKIPVAFEKECGTIKIFLEKQLLFDEKVFTII